MPQRKKKKKNTHYEFAPIVEAVIDIQFSNANALEDQPYLVLEKRIGAEFPIIKPIIESSFVVQMEAKTQSSSINSRQEQAGFRYESSDKKRILQVRNNRFTYSLMAPYTNWEDFFGAAHRLWVVHERIFKPAKINQLGLRYINRVDIPNKIIDLKNYFSLYPHTPEKLSGPMKNFLLRLVFPANEEGCQVVVTQTRTKPPIEDINSIILDVDVTKAISKNFKKEDMQKAFNKMRSIKNDLFEAFITPKTRKLFGRVKTTN